MRKTSFRGGLEPTQWGLKRFQPAAVAATALVEGSDLGGTEEVLMGCGEGREELEEDGRGRLINFSLLFPQEASPSCQVGGG